MTRTPPFSVDRCPVTGLAVRREPAWTDVPVAQGYTVSFCIVGERILATAPSGNSGTSGIPRFFEVRERVLREAGLWEREHVEIKDFAGVPHDHPRLGRAQLAQGMLAEFRRGMLRGFWGYNGPPAFGWIFKVATKLTRLDDASVGYVEDYAAAIRLAAAAQADLMQRPPVLAGPRDRLGLMTLLNRALAPLGIAVAEGRPGRWRLGLLGRRAGKEQTWTRVELQAHADELLRAVGSINWELEGIDALALDRISADSPLRGVYEAIALIKRDFDSILREKEEMQAQVLRAAKLASLGTLSAGMAHELNNPLTAVLGFAQRLARSDDPETRSSAGVMIRAADRMKSVVDKLLQTSRQEALGHGDAVDLNVAVREGLLLFERQLQARKIRIDLQLAEELPRVRGDANHLEALVTNLVTNALDAFDTREQSRDGQEKWIRIQTAAEPGWIKLEVEDNGCGMPAQVAARAFDPFFTTKSVGRGSGLGLYVSHMIAKEHNGYINLRSEVGRGTIAEVTFPDLS